ncbi:MAG: 4Fe-4S binding protein [Candidatus Omnitrophica bacterium]|nr:4Fe-4S binding protein [Candidatus Omnitrophota bacterium]
MAVKKAQLIMIWFLPLIVIGGLFFPLLGYLMVGMMVFFLVMSFFRARYWCWNLCPRGAFLDIVMSKFTLNKPFPGFFARGWFRLAVFVLLMGFMLLRILRSGGNRVFIGAVFVGICLITTIIAVILAVFTKHRGWCAICPMGFLQEKIGRIRGR